MADWHSTTVVVPQAMLRQDSSELMKRFVGIMTGHDVVPCEGSTGHGEFCEEGDVSYYNTKDGLGYTLSYNWVPYNWDDVGYDMGRVTKFAVSRDERFDGMFDITRERLADVLNEQVKLGKLSEDAAIVIGGQFGIVSELEV